MNFLISFILAIWETITVPSSVSSVLPQSPQSPQSPEHPQHHSIWDRIRYTPAIIRLSARSNAECFLKILPSANLHFHSCYSTFECARLDVPLDWKNEATDSQRVAIALIRLPAKVDVSDPRYGGSILINPGISNDHSLRNVIYGSTCPSSADTAFLGGPGGSGIKFARLHGNNLQTIVDSPFSPDDAESTRIEKYFDIIAFDPRGVGFTTPSFTCFANAQQRWLWQVASETDGLLGSSDVAFSRMWARKKALAETCYSQVGDEGIGTRMNTPIIAMDMAAIVEALARWRGKWTQFSQPIREPQNPIEKPDLRLYKLQYWGFSYGTLLGETFASMYPHLVGRLVLDGIVDSDRHYAGTWDGNINDADAIMERFSIYCYQAGPDKCDLFSEKGPRYIQSSLDDIVAFARNTTKSVLSAHGPEIVTYSDVQKIIRDSLYEPFKEFDGLARALNNLANGDGSIIANRKQTSPPQDIFFEPADYAEEVVGAISCSDGPDQSNTTKGEFVEYWQKMRHQSIYLGDRWSQNRLLCLFWKTRLEFTYSALKHTLTTIGISKGPIGVLTEPILFIGNSLDPVTSLDKYANLDIKSTKSATYINTLFFAKCQKDESQVSWVESHPTKLRRSSVTCNTLSLHRKSCSTLFSNRHTSNSWDVVPGL
ncbi:uncharacterized protein N7498_002738 [Penicillium cinerascens]|uniref:AB hydrolase-1 domain-containing protein n=1 Tax=Penicillium cinerascens TaxID=70096 RepID=A0A9W9NAR2_9EURO|nr:uncharacterized protein N7498_002738 [Penicillium cinerascens]KAJ5216331.1 hypothetical protein N7498_002738 [Penicillium cinerascens]